MMSTICHFQVLLYLGQHEDILTWKIFISIAIRDCCGFANLYGYPGMSRMGMGVIHNCI